MISSSYISGQVDEDERECLRLDLLPTLDEFIKRKMPNSYVQEPGFDSLYVRNTRRWINNQWVDTLDIGNVTADYPGRGAFTRLIKRLRKDYPLLNIYVESVMTKRFNKKLTRIGFTEVGFPDRDLGEIPGNFILCHNQELKSK